MGSHVKRTIQKDSVSYIVKAAITLGFSRDILSTKSLKATKTKPKIELIGVSTVQEFLEVLFS